MAGYEWRDGADGLGYYRRPDARAESLLVLRLAAAAGAPFVRCAEDVGAVAGYDFRECGGAGDDTGYYRVRREAPVQAAPAYDEFERAMQELGAV